MHRDSVLRVLSAHWKQIAEDYGVRRLAVFGSVARGDATSGSDVDILVEFLHPPGFDRYMQLKFYLEALLRCRVDLVMDSALKPWARETVLQEAIYVPELETVSSGHH
jgi:Predicted nucleotidyltransferases